MMQKNSSRLEKFYPFVFVCIFFCITLTIQSHFLVNWDVTWDLLVTKRVLAGGNYIRDFFDLNPPVNWYLYSPVALMEQFFGISRATALTIYFYLFGFLSFALCYKIIKKIFLTESNLLQNFLAAIILIIFFLVPQIDFGQREHLLIILIFPYILLRAYRLQTSIAAVSTIFAVLIGIFAGLGSAIKPYYCVVPILIEFYCLYSTRSFLKILKIEMVVLALFLVFYAAFVFIYYPNYIYAVVPLAKQFYYSGFSDPWELVLRSSNIMFCYFIIVFCVAYYARNPYKKLTMVLLMALLAFLITYFMQRTDWSYHVYPALSVAIFMVALLFSLFSMQTIKNKIIIILIGLMIFAFPAYRTNKLYVRGMTLKNNSIQLGDFIKKHAAHKPIYFFTASCEMISIVNDSGAVYGSRLEHLLWIPGMLKLNYPNLISQPEQKKAEQFFINMVKEDLTIQKPEFIFVDVRKIKPFFSLIPFNYLDYFLRDPQFQTIWKHYHYLTTIEGPLLKFIDPDQWDLYTITSSNNISQYKFEDSAVILTGKGHSRSAYFISRQKIISSKYNTLTNKINLTQEEQSILQKSGKVEKTMKNRSIVNQIINKAAAVPSYKFAIYQLEKRE